MDRECYASVDKELVASFLTLKCCEIYVLRMVLQRILIIKLYSSLGILKIMLAVDIDRWNMLKV